MEVRSQTSSDSSVHALLGLLFLSFSKEDASDDEMSEVSAQEDAACRQWQEVMKGRDYLSQATWLLVLPVVEDCGLLLWLSPHAAIHPRISAQVPNLRCSSSRHLQFSILVVSSAPSCLLQGVNGTLHIPMQRTIHRETAALVVIELVMLYGQVQQNMVLQQLHLPWPMGSSLALPPDHTTISRLSLKRSFTWFPMRLEASSQRPSLSDREAADKSGNQSDDACMAPLLLTAGSQASNHPLIASQHTLRLWHGQPSTSVALLSDASCHTTVRCAAEDYSCVLLQ